MNPDLEIARRAVLQPIVDIGASLGIGEDDLEFHGRHKAKISYPFLQSLNGGPQGKLILVTAMSPPPAGGGKPRPASDSATRFAAWASDRSSVCANHRSGRASG